MYVFVLGLVCREITVYVTGNTDVSALRYKCVYWS